MMMQRLDDLQGFSRLDLVIQCRILAYAKVSFKISFGIRKSPPDRARQFFRPDCRLTKSA